MDKFLEEILFKLNEIDTALRMIVNQACKAFEAYAKMEITVITLKGFKK
jgi:hypothetical protein